MRPRHGSRGRRSTVAVTIGMVLLSGALAAIGGFVIATGLEDGLRGFLSGYGFSGILIAFLAKTIRSSSWSSPSLRAPIETGRSLQVFYQYRSRWFSSSKPSSSQRSPPPNSSSGTPSTDLEVRVMRFRRQLDCELAGHGNALRARALGLIIGERAGVLSLTAEGLMMVVTVGRGRLHCARRLSDLARDRHVCASLCRSCSRSWSSCCA